MKHLLLFLVAVATFGSQSFAEAQPSTTDPTEKLLIQMERDWAQALVQGDAAQVEKFLAADYSVTDPDGILATRAEFLADFKSGALKFRALSLENMKVRVVGDAAIVTSVNATKGNYKGVDISGRSRWTDVFLKRDGNWQAAASHGTNIKGK